MSNKLLTFSTMALGMIVSNMSMAGGPDNMSPPIDNTTSDVLPVYSSKFLPPIDGTQFVLALSGGAAWTSAGSTQTIYTQPEAHTCCKHDRSF